jgi:D-glycero-D-manno-heptose 1,7-bisphosphate phosphatase
MPPGPPPTDVKTFEPILYQPPRSRLRTPAALDPTRRAVFLDRDGTIVEEVDHLTEPSELALLPGSVEAIRALQEKFLIVVVTNQSAVARGWLSEDKLLQIHQTLDGMLEQRGALLDAVLACPHHPKDGCRCRKPEPGLLYRAQDELGIQLDRSFLVGDKGSDILAGQRAGVQATLVVPSCQTAASLRGEIAYDYVARDLQDAAQWILSRLQRDDEMHKA